MDRPCLASQRTIRITRHERGHQLSVNHGDIVAGLQKVPGRCRPAPRITAFTAGLERAPLRYRRHFFAVPFATRRAFARHGRFDASAASSLEGPARSFWLSDMSVGNNLYSGTRHR
jgi:hypothetical protein